MLANGPKAEKAVGVFDGAFLPGAVGVGVVDRGADDAFEGGGAEELAPVVGEQRLHGLQLLLAHEFLEGGADGFLADFGEFDGVGFAGLAFGEGEEAALPASAGVDGVHFPDAEGLLAAEKGFGHVQDGVAGGAAFGNASFPLGGVDALAFALFRQPRGVHPGAGASCRDAVVNRFDARDPPVPPRRLPEDLRAILVIPKGRFQVLEGRRGAISPLGLMNGLSAWKKASGNSLASACLWRALRALSSSFRISSGKRCSCLFPKREGRQVCARVMMSRNELSGTPNPRAIWLSDLGFFRHRFLSYASNILLRSATE